MLLLPLVVRDLAWSAPDRVVLDGVDLTVSPGQRVGLIGENGSGKSTLLRLVAGELVPSRGSIEVPEDLGYLAQHTAFAPGATVRSVLEDALRPLHDGVERLEQLAARLAEADADQGSIAGTYDATLEWVTAHDAWDAERRAVLAAQRLGLADIDHDRPVAELSGGQRSRLALAALLTRRPSCLVLDEPTNHLDDDALAFLEDELCSLPGVVLVATHDRVFLDAVCTALVDLDPSHFGTDGDGGRRFSGGYSSYQQHKLDARRRWEDAFLAQHEELNALRDKAVADTSAVAHNRAPRDNDKFIYGFKGANVQQAARRRARGAEQRIARIERELVPKPPAPLCFSGDFDARDPGWATVHDLWVAGRMTLGQWQVEPGERVLVTGANGSGKSTLLHVLAGRLPHEGQVHVSARHVGLLTQDVELPDPDASPRELYRLAREAADGDSSSVPLRSLGLIHPRDLHRPVSVLSLGQQRRLALALLLAGPTDLLLLDEPTNHLSLALVEELEDALRTTPATVVVASHDRWLRRRWRDRTTSLG